MKSSWAPSASVQQVPQPSKSMFPYSVGSFFWTPRSGSTKWQKNIGLSFDSVYMKKSCLVKLLVYWKQIWWWKVKHIPAVSSTTSITYTLNVLLIKRTNFQVKQNRFFVKRINVCFKRIQKIAEISLSKHSRKWEIYFAFSVTFLCITWCTMMFVWCITSHKCSYKNLLLKILQHLPEKTHTKSKVTETH